MGIKRGVALAGGGSRGAYQIGVWRAMRECGLDFQMVSGTSVGALNGALFVQDDYENARDLWRRLTAQDVANVDISQAMEAPDPGAAVYAQFLRTAITQGGVDITGLESLMRAVVDEERFYASPVDFGLVTVEYPALRPMVMRKEQIPRGKLCDYLVASASCFPAFPAKNIDNVQFIDGAYHDNLPINLCIEMGAQEIVAVDLEAVGLKKRPRDPRVPITLIRPVHSLGPFLMFEPSSARRNMRLGYLDALRAFGKGEGGYITLEPGVTRTLLEALAPYVRSAASLVEKPEDKTLWGALRARLTRAPTEEDLEGVVQHLARWYELDVETLYTAHTYCYELLLRFNASPQLASAEIADELKAPGLLGQRVERLAQFGHKRLVEHIYSRLRDLSFGRGDAGEMRALEAALQNETAGALFLFALKRYLAGE